MVFSTYVEVIPISLLYFLMYGKYSPRMWRWSQAVGALQTELQVFSTYVEVIPRANIYLRGDIGILHVCGGDPQMDELIRNESRYSPRMWRWSHQREISWC